MKKDNLIFIHKLLKAIADSIIKIFIPLFILKTTDNLALAIGYLTIYSVLTNIILLLFKKIIEKYGIITIILHFVFIVATEAILSFAEINWSTVAACSLLMAFAQAFYSVPLNLIFAFGDKKSNVAKFQIATNVGKLIFTLVSGMILSSSIKNSFLIMSIVSSIFYILSVIPIGYSYKELKENYEKIQNNLKQNNENSKKLDKRFNYFHIFFGLFQATIDNIVPLFLYINNLSFKSITIFIALVELGKISINYLAKFLIQKNKQIIACSISVVIFVSSLICVLVAKNNIVIYIFSCLTSLSFPLTFVPMFKLFCQNAVNSENAFMAITYRDVYIFSLRPVDYMLYFLGLGLYPNFIVGIASIITMWCYELKLLKDKNNL